MPATFATATDTGRVRRSNEDALFARPPVFMIADGMGGPQGGEVASAVTAKAFEWFCPQGGPPAEELTTLIQKVNNNIFQLAANEGRPGMGTTVTSAMLSDGKVVLAHVGDSRAYLWREKSLRQLTEDHSLVAEMVRSGKISAGEALVHPQRSIITRALGVDDTVEVDTLSTDWKQGDVFLLCTDGLYSMVPDEEIAAALQRGERLDKTAKRLIEAANRRGGHDNISVVLFCPDGSVPGAAGGDADTGVIRIPDGAGGVGAAVQGMPVAGQAGKHDHASSRAAKKSYLSGIFHWLFKTVPGLLLSAGVIILIILGAAWVSISHVYFLGVDDGRIAVFQGVPHSIGPLELFSVKLKSQVRLDELAQYEQDQIARKELHSYDGAKQILDNYAAETSGQKEQPGPGGQSQGSSTLTGTTGASPAAVSPAAPAGGSNPEVAP